MEVRWSCESEDVQSRRSSQVKWKTIAPVKKTRSSGNKLPGDLPNRVTSETRAHVGCDFGPFWFEVRIHETQEQLSVNIVIPGPRHDEVNRRDGCSRIGSRCETCKQNKGEVRLK